MSNIPANNPGVVTLNNEEIDIVSLLGPNATPQNSPKVINGNVRKQIILADPLTGAPLDLQNAIVNGSVSSVNGQGPDGSGNVTLTKSNISLGNVDNTSDATKNAAVATLTNKTLTSPTINGGTVSSATVSSPTITGGTVDGFSIGYKESPINSKSAAYTTVLTDAGKTIFHPASDTNARTWTIDSNANVAYPLGTMICFDNDVGAGVITIAITSDTLVLVGAAGSTGSRTLAAGGRAVAIKVATTRWRISGSVELT